MNKSVKAYVIDKMTQDVKWYFVDVYKNHIVVCATGQRLTKKFIEELGWEIIEGPPPDPNVLIERQMAARRNNART